MRTEGRKMSPAWPEIRVNTAMPVTVIPIISRTELGLSSETLRKVFHRTWKRALAKMKRKPFRVMGSSLVESVPLKRGKKPVLFQT